MQRPAGCAVAWCDAFARRAGGALLPRLFAVPGGEGLRAPTPGPPTRGKLSLQAFARCRARAALRAGVSVLAHGATRMFVLAHGATRRIVLAHAATRRVR